VSQARAKSNDGVKLVFGKQPEGGIAACQVEKDAVNNQETTTYRKSTACLRKQRLPHAPKK
jgi:hypothetical protein